MTLQTRSAMIGFLLLFACAGFGGGAGGITAAAQAGDSSPKQTTAADCSFERDPESYRAALRRTLEAISLRTSHISNEIHTASERGPSPPKSSSDSTDSERKPVNYIDEFIFRRMNADSVPHAALSTDAEFLRRVTLDLTGRIPTIDNVRAFLDDKNPDKRATLIITLLSSPEFVDKWTMYYGDLLRNTSADSNITRYAEGRNAFYTSIRDFVANRMPYDVFVKNLLTATGSTWSNGAGNWEVGAFTPMGPIQDTYDALASRAGSEFLGLANMDCLLCHSGAHHLESVNLWASKATREQAWGMAAFFSRYRFTRSANQSTTGSLYYWTISEAGSGEYRLNTTAGNRKPRTPLPDGSQLIKPRYMFSNDPPQGSTYRETFANYLVKDRQFARASVNYLWKEMMGLGIVEPADQFDPARLVPGTPLPPGWTVQPSHPELLEALTDDFIAGGFDIRHILGVIANSRAYQLSSRFDGEWQEGYTPYFARKYIRRLTAEEVHDGIARATGVPGSYTVQGIATPVEWAMQLPETQGPNNAGEPRSNAAVAAFLNFFLRGNRDQNPRSGEATIFQALNMMNNSFVLTRIRNSNHSDAVSRLLSDSSLSDAAVVQELYLRTLGRYPTSSELGVALKFMAGDRIGGTENLAWVLLNKIDFLYNY